MDFVSHRNTDLYFISITNWYYISIIINSNQADISRALLNSAEIWRCGSGSDGRRADPEPQRGQLERKNEHMQADLQSVLFST